MAPIPRFSYSCLLALVDSGRENADIGQVAVHLVVVQTIAHNKRIGDLEAGIVHREGRHAAGGLIQQRGNAQAGSAAEMSDFFKKFSVMPLSTMSSTMMTSRPRMLRSRSLTSLTSPLDLVLAP